MSWSLDYRNPLEDDDPEFDPDGDQPYDYPDDEPDECAADISDCEETQDDPIAVRNTRALKSSLGMKSGENILTGVLAVLDTMKKHDLNVPLFLDALFYGNTECHANDRCSYARTSLMVSDELPILLRRWYRPPRRPNGKKSKRPVGGKKAIDSFALECTVGRIDRELRSSAHHFISEPKDFSEKSLLALDFDDLTSTVQETNPTLWEILRKAAYTPSQETRNKHKNPNVIICNIVSQLQYTRSARRGRVAKLWAVYLKACGLSARAFDALHALGITMSHRWANSAFKDLSAQAMEKVRRCVHERTWLMEHDNLNLAMRAFSMRIHNQSHFISATAATVWLLPKHVKLPSNIKKLYMDFLRTHCTKQFDLAPIIFGEEPRNTQIFEQNVYRVLRFLLDTPEFAGYYEKHRNDPAFTAPEPVTQLLGGDDAIVEGCLLPTIEQEEASYDGNLKVIDAYFRELLLHSEDEQRKTGLERLIFWLGDQLTSDRLQGLRKTRHEDHNSYDRMDWMIPLFGWFHLVMAYANSLHKQYLGTSSTTGGLRQAFDLLKRKGLITQSTKGPFWHHLDEAIHHISEAHFLASWLAVARVGKISDLTECSPSILRQLAVEVVQKQASRSAMNSLDRLPKGKQDHVLRQSIMWNMDVLGYLDLRDAIQSGDVGRMENLLPTLLIRFAGGNNSNYAGEVMNLLQGLRQEWTPELREHVRRWCWIFTRTGKPDSYLAYDLGQEESIGDIKYNYKSTGPGTTIEYIGQLSPAIPTLRRTQRHVEVQFQTNRRGAKHGVPTKDADVKMLLDNYCHNGLHIHKEGRVGFGANAAPDYMTKGAQVVEKQVAEWFRKRTLERGLEEDYST